jgi:metallo-beta-lactamase family protein
MAKLTAYGGAGSATGANFLFEIGGKKVLIDCGMEQGGEGANAHNRTKFPYDVSSVNALFVTHAHIDHVGLIPKLFAEGFRGEIYSTLETKEIGGLLMADAAKINNSNETPLYTFDDIAGAVSLWKTLDYHKPHDFGTFTVELYDAGHVLGSAMFKFTCGGKSMLFTGDLGNSPSILLADVEKVKDLDYILMESVYGDRNHEDRALREEKFKKIVGESIQRGGALLLPAFSLERTQEILILLDQMFEKEKSPSAPVYLDSPLALKITEIFEQAHGRDPFNFKELIKIANVEESHQIAAVPGPKIIIAGSGMSTAGRILGHEEHYLPDPNSTILFMGYQSAGTLGRQIEEGVKKVTIKNRNGDKQVDVRARVEKIDGFSGHADSNALVDFVSESKETLKKVFVAMGEQRSQIFLAQRLRDELGIDAVATEVGKTYEIEL